ncbi:hypothetical protein IVB18_08185 [Bradyrhizobium sp. 186]|nr:hypothetical protein IVB18_08185 [Bradyrhizobium sp. 186]
MLFAGAREGHRYHADHHGGGCRQDGPQPGLARLESRLRGLHARLAPVAGKRDQEDRVRRGDAHCHDRAHERGHALSGELPSPASPPSGCVFRTRCPHAVAGCAESVPVLREIAPGRRVACLRDDVVAQGA